MPAAAMAGIGFGIVAPIENAMVRLTTPAVQPFVPAMMTGAPPATLRVKLLSNAQHAQAPPTAKAPHGGPASGRPVHDSRIPPAVIASIPKAIRRSKFSRNTNHARSAVSTPSRFNSSDADDAGVAD